jgi:hypothetical protein
VLVAHRGARQRLAGGGLDEVAQLPRCGLRRLAVDEEAVLAFGRDRHRG